MEEDIFQNGTELEDLQKQVNELKESLNGLNPRNLAGLNSISVYDAAFPNINDGSDGDLNIASGTTTLDLGGASTFTKNYASIRIASGATLAFSNPADNGTIIQLKSRSDVTIDGTINASGAGAASQYPGYGTINFSRNGGNGNNDGAGSVISKGASASAADFYPLNITGKVIKVTPGAGGGVGGNSPYANGGAGGRGGAALIIECKGKYTCTGTITVAGLAGTAGGSGGGSGAGAGGGGGGAGGVIAILYKTLGTNTGTYTVSGGNGGAGGSGINPYGGSGAAGGANLFYGGAGGNSGAAGSTGGGTGGGTGGAAGGGGTNGGGGGGGGSAGGSYVVLNTEFV